jgi:peptidoglycan/LPS O-acetylase OafA/YrhL
MQHASRPISHLFGTLDGMRGVAAVAVVFYHFGGRTDLRWLLPRGYLAVDFFFVLSGFVLAHAYTRRLQSGLTASRFVAQRLIRLLPVLLPGSLIGAVLEFGRPHVGTMIGHLHEVALATALGFLALPLPLPTSMEQTIFPINGPVWSLFFEIFANIVFIAVAKSLAVRGWSIVLGVAGALGMVLTIHLLGRFDAGPLLIDWLGGFPRVLYSFFVGVLLSGIHARLPAAPVAAGLIWLFPCLLITTFVVPHISMTADPIIDLGFVLLMFPLLVWFAAGSTASAALSRIFDVAGKLSYPLYAVHYPIVRLIGFVLLHHSVSIAGQLAVVAISVVGLTILGWIVFRFYDQPVRRALTLRLLPASGARSGLADANVP